MSTDRDWEKWGAADPYFGVYSDEKFRSESMTAAARAEFFASGETHVATILATIKDTFDPAFVPSAAMDFGSGVGRLVIPLARRISNVLGVDVSASMIAECTANCRKAGVDNVRFARSDDTLSAVAAQFDLVHSYIVLQHIPWRRGRRILQAMADRVRPGGYLVVQILTACTEQPLIRGLVRLRYAIPPLNWLSNLLRSRPLFEPAMQLHVYRLQDVQNDLRERGFGTAVCVDESLGDIRFKSVILYAKRAASSAAKLARSSLVREARPAKPASPVA